MVEEVLFMRPQTFVMSAAILALAAPLTACAEAPSGYSNASFAAGYGAQGGAALTEASYTQTTKVDGLLPEPPKDAHAGECYAKVTVPGQPIYGPPAGPHLKWVQNPPQPGTIGPVWCQVWEQGFQPTVSYSPEQYGWIRVICDHDATREKIGHIQHRLHEYGDYQGGYDGAYDAATAAGVVRFQHEHHIEHGGYLSYQTMSALEAAPPAPVAPQYAAQSYAPPVYRVPVYQPPIYQAQTYQAQGYGYAPQPCPGPCAPVVQPPCPGPCAGQGYGQGGQYSYQQGSRRWLTWSGKSGY
jgi:hypothetical protein